MKTIGSHPGAILFRLGIMVVLIAIMISVFFSYLENTERQLERSSVLQTRQIINSALVVVFSTYAANNRLDELNELDGGNPFIYLSEYEMLPRAYVGALDTDVSADHSPGWYYLSHRKLIVYKSYFTDADSYFATVLNYEDRNQTGQFEARDDRFLNLHFTELAKAEVLQ